MKTKKDLKQESNPLSKAEEEATKTPTGLTRRDFMKFSTGTAAACVSLGSLGFLAACGGDDNGVPVARWPIADDVYTTAEHQILPVAVPADVPHINPNQVSLYEQYGYSAWQVGPGLDHELRSELAPGYDPNATSAARLLTFFSMSDIHIADKESPAQPIYWGWSSAYGSQESSAYSPICLSTPQVLDAAIQTVNALHERTPFDFGISLGDDCNNTQYNELRWFIDVMDGKVITPSSGAHAGNKNIDYQKAFKAAGLNKKIPWYQVIGNHDQFWSGCALENEKTLQAHISNTILNMGNDPDPIVGINQWGYYMGVVDGTTPYGDVIKSGPQGDFPTLPTIIADPDRHSLSTLASTTLNWMREFFTTTTYPVGHGFTQTNLDNDFSCYSFQPKSDIPIKVIVLDDACTGVSNSPDYAGGYLDQTRLDWLTGELQEGQDNNKLMIIAAHIPVNPQTQLIDDGTHKSVFISPTDTALITMLQNYPNLLMWISGHRHVNVVSPQPYNPATPGQGPENSFWVVETCSLRDFPQQFRTFDIRRNSDNTVSVIITNVDPAVKSGSPAAKSRGYAIGAARVYGSYAITDTSSQSYNAVLVKQLTPAMQAVIANCGSSIE